MTNPRASTEPLTVTVEMIQVFQMRPDNWSWEVTFDDPGLNQDGYVPTYTRAMQCVRAALENAGVDTYIPEIA